MEGVPGRAVRRMAAVLAALALTATACGTRVDRDAYFTALEARAGEAPGEEAAPDGTAVAGTSVSQQDAPGDARTTGTGAGAGARLPRTATTAKSGGPPKPGAIPNVSTERVGDTVRIGMHVPETGAAPVPTDFRDVFAVLEQHLNANPVHGRKVEFLIEDDGYDPAVGLAACRKIEDGDPLFVIGHTQPAVQDACAGLFQSRGVPYLMRGTNQDVLNGRSLAYFGTIPDDIQGGLLGDYVIRRLGGAGKKAAVVYGNDQVAAKDAFTARVKAGGGSVVVTEESVPRQPDFSAVVQKLQQSGAEFVFLSLPPVNAIKLSVQAQGQGYHPTWLGGGSYWNYNMVLESAGAALDGAVSFSPWASVDSPDASEFRAVYQRARPGKQAPDIGLIVWGWAMLARHALQQAGPDLSRATLVNTLNTLQFTSPYWNPITYSAADHRGASAVAVFRADGQAKRWRQISGFATSF